MGNMIQTVQQQAMVKLHVQNFENMVSRRGRPVLWQEAIMCSCWNPTSQQPLYGCKACDGKGYTYGSGIQCTTLVQSVANTKEFDEMAGMFEVGDAIATVPNQLGGVNNPMFAIGMYDRITLLDDAYKTSEVLVKGTPIYARPADTLINPLVVSIRAVQTADTNTGVITKYSEGTDFTLNGAQIVWSTTSTNVPAQGAQYSVVYTHRPVYTVFAVLPKPRHQDGQDLPRYVALRFLAGGVGGDGQS